MLERRPVANGSARLRSRSVFGGATRARRRTRQDSPRGVMARGCASGSPGHFIPPTAGEKKRAAAGICVVDVDQAESLVSTLEFGVRRGWIR